MCYSMIKIASHATKQVQLKFENQLSTQNLEVQIESTSAN